MTVDFVLNNAKAYVKHAVVDCSIAIESGRILKIGKESQMPRADERTDLHNLLVLPGVIDSHVHLRDEGKAYKETFATGTAAAAAGGVTTVLDMPNNSPVTMSGETLRNRMNLAQRRILVNVGFFSEFPASSSEMEEIVDAGAVGFKLFMADPVGALDIDDDEAVAEAFAEEGKLGVPVAVHAEDHALLKKAVDALKLANRHDLAAFLKAHDENVELAAVKRLLSLSQHIEMHLHFCHISTEQALAAVAEAQKSGSQVTCEATPHHLFLSKADLERLGTAALTTPPLRAKSHVEALWKSIGEGTVTVIGSDHAPHTAEEKNAGSVWDVKVGVPGLETTLPLMLTAVHRNRLTLDRAVQLLAETPAELFSLKDRGSLEQEKAADFVVVDFYRKWKVDASRFQSKAKFSPFDGWEVQGKPVKTFVNGVLVMDDGEVVAKPGSGSVLRRG
ncbi:MAG: dihydroorotase family protein [Candidatus Bathyarchaeia archaeon]